MLPGEKRTGVWYVLEEPGRNDFPAASCGGGAWNAYSSSTCPWEDGMAFIYLNLFPHRERGQLNPEDVIVRLQEAFPEAIVLPGDQLALSARRAEQNLDQTNPANRTVVQKLWWDARHLGPAYAFYIPAEPGSRRIDGVIRRYQADFHSDAPLSEAMQGRILTFLRSLIPQGLDVEIGMESGEEAEVV
jgi:hypothetical protein